MEWLFGSLVAITIFAAIIAVAAAVCGVIKSLWFRFRWHVLGWKPVIFSEGVMSKTVTECAQSVNKQLADLELSDEEKRQRIEEVEWMIRDVIFCYARNFSRYR